MQSAAATFLSILALAVLTAAGSADDSPGPGGSSDVDGSDDMAAVEELRAESRFADAAQMAQSLLIREIERSGETGDAAKELRAACDELTRLQELVDHVAQLKQADEFAEAADAARRVLALELLHYGPDHPNVVECRGWCQSLDQATATQRESWAGIVERVDTSLAQRNMDEAIGWSVALLKFKRNELGNRHTETAEALIRLATLEERDGRAQTALPRYEEAVKTLTAVLGADHWRVAEAELDLRTAAAMGRLPRDDQYSLVRTEMRAAEIDTVADVVELESALTQLQADLALIDDLVGSENRFYILTLLSLGDVCLRLGRVADADRSYQRATDLVFEICGRSHQLSATALSRLAGSRSQLADHAAAVGYAQQAAELADEVSGPFSEDYLARLRTLGFACYFAGMPVESLASSENCSPCIARFTGSTIRRPARFSQTSRTIIS